jgi:hypothetical protein
MTTATYYHGGCEVCSTVERGLLAALDKSRFAVEDVNLTLAPGRVAEAERAGVKTIPALVVGGVPFHINFGANLADRK